MAYTQPPSARYTKFDRVAVECTGRLPSSSARRSVPTGAISPSRMPSATAAPAAANTGRASRKNDTPDAFAAVISECRPMGLMVKTVANNTAAGSTRNMTSGR